MMNATNYEATVKKLTERIAALIPKHPEIMQMDSPWDLFKVKGFKCDDLAPSSFQAGCALREAQQAARAKKEAAA